VTDPVALRERPVNDRRRLSARAVHLRHGDCRAPVSQLLA